MSVSLSGHRLVPSQFFADLADVEVKSVRAAGGLTSSPTGAIWIGRQPPSNDPQRASALILDNKSARYDSVVEMMLRLPDDRFAAWPLWSRRPLLPQAVLDEVTLVVEDASPDSVIGVLVLLARMAQCDIASELTNWRPVIMRWESRGSAPQRNAWPVLASALGHAHFGRVADQRDAEYRAAWTAVLRFAAECLCQELDPAAIPESANTPSLGAARAAYEQEQQGYRDVLTHAQKLQLSLPIRGTPARRRLVDALLFVEDDPSGSLKEFYRQDRTHSPLGEGFVFSAVYRPAAAPGEDITITVDPERGVSLHEIWEELERQETTAWAGARPVDAPRESRLGDANQPWWLTGDETLVASPRAVSDQAGNLLAGSKLNWIDVQRAIWRAGNPLRGVEVERLDGTVILLSDLPPEELLVGARRTVRIAKWHSQPDRVSGSPRSLTDAPVIHRILAALTRRTSNISDISALPPDGFARRVLLTGGFAIASEDGVLLLDDWIDAAHPDLKALRSICAYAVRLDQDLVTQEKELRVLSDSFDRSIKGASSLVEGADFAARAAGLGVELAALRGKRPHPGTADGVALLEALENAWALRSRLTEMEAQVRAISESNKTLGDANIRVWTQIVAVVAFPFYLATGIAKPLANLAILGGSGLGFWDRPKQDGGDPSTVAWWITAIIVFVLSWRIAKSYVERSAERAAATHQRKMP